MPATPILDPARGESLVGTEPQLLQQVDPGWRRRLNLFTGRALSDTALDSEQAYRSGLLTTLGQSVTSGTVKGLNLSLDATGTAVTVTPGYGISGSGEDVVLNTKLTTSLSSIAVIDAATGTQQLTLFEWQSDPTNQSFAGILLLQPIVAQVSGQELDTGSAPLIVSGNLSASCSQDPDEYAFEDWQIADAVRLVFLPWNAGVASLPLPAANPQQTLRNRLAYAIFEAESMLGLDDEMPWSMVGVPVGLIAFDTASWKPIFVDCNSVVRAGGLPRQRFVLPSQPEPLVQWLPNVSFGMGEFVVDPTGNVQIVQTAGTTGLSVPAWPPAYGSMTNDNTVVWKNNGPASWSANTAYSAGQFIFDVNGNIQRVQVAGSSGVLEPVWNGVFLTTDDGSLVWTNAGSGTSPIVQPALGQARVHQLAEQLSQTMAQGEQIDNLSSFFTALPPSGLLPVDAVNFSGQSAPWLPPNWAISAAPVRFEELETALETGMAMAPLSVENGAPSDVSLFEPVELLVPLPDAVYDPRMLVVETVDPVFQQEVNAATAKRNVVLQQQAAVQQQVNALISAIGPNVPVTAGLLNIDTGLTTAEIAGRNLPPPYLPDDAELFGASLQTTWTASVAHAAGDILIDTNGAIQVAQTQGTTAAQVPTWGTDPGDTTTDGNITWLNNGAWAWQSATAYVVGQFVVDANGTRHTVTTAGISANSAPQWNDAAGAQTLDGVVWICKGSAMWESDTLYAVGDILFDAHGNIQQVTAGGISGDSAPAWNLNQSQTTQDSAVTWQNLGRNLWQSNAAYQTGQAIVDTNQQVQLVQAGGITGTTQPVWQREANATTMDAAVIWNNSGSFSWQANTTYASGGITFDSNGNLQTATNAGVSGGASPAWATVPGAVTSDGAITWQRMAYVSNDLQQLLSVVNQAPYTTTFTDSTGAQQQLALLSASDIAMLQAGGNGLQALITSLSARIASANDLLDTGFLTAQTDIYRYRQNVLGATAATTLATSPVLANIATGETAAATAANLQTYFNTLLPTTQTPPSTSGSTPTDSNITTTPVRLQPFKPLPIRVLPINRLPELAIATPVSTTPKLLMRSAALNVNLQATASTSATSTVVPVLLNSAPSRQILNTPTPILEQQRTALGSAVLSSNLIKSTIVSPSQIQVPGRNATVTTADITNQSPLAGAQLNVRTLTIAQRLQQSPSQEAMFYSISNRLNFMQDLETLCADLGLVMDDLSVLVDDAPAQTDTPGSIPTKTYTLFEARTNANTKALLLSKIQSPYLVSDVGEATLYSTGVRVVEQHSTLMRAIEARIQQYSNFVGLCHTALGNMTADIANARSYLTQLHADLLQSRQDVAFTTSLLSDEQQRVQAVNAQRQQILATQVSLVAYTRARSLEAIDTAPTRQLVPSNIASPVPACLQQSISIPPELREIIAQLREAPVNWMPSVSALMPKLERPVLLQHLALSVQARATQMLQLSSLPSSARGEARVYAGAIDNIHSANQQVFQVFQTERAAIQPSALSTMSWSSQVVNLQRFAAINDLITAEAVHTEVSNAVARTIQQVSSVATCLYTRMSSALPVDRLAWANFLTGPGSSAALSSLAILPSWNSLDYTERQQMQMLTDWLFQQIDNTNTQASAFMSDVVRTAILLASDVPIDDIVPGNVLQRVQPSLGASLKLTLPSERVAAGMFVHLYSGGVLAAKAVVSDLDAVSVSATVTDVLQPSVFLETNDVAHFTAQTPQAVAVRSFFGKLS